MASKNAYFDPFSGQNRPKMALFDPAFVVFGYKMVSNSADQRPRSRESVARWSLTVVALKLASLSRAVFQFSREI